MAKISEAAKAECNRMQDKYKVLFDANKVKLDKLEQDIATMDDELDNIKYVTLLNIIYVWRLLQ